MQWQADSVQAIVYFPPMGGFPGAAELWGELFPNDLPDAFQRNPASPNLASSASGERSGHAIAINCQQGQVTVHINPVFKQLPGMTPMASSPPRIIDVVGASNLAIDLIQRATSRRQIARAALILDLATTAPAEVQASSLSEVLPQVPFPRGAIEPSYGFNSQRPFSAAPHIPMNRICAWTFGQVGFISGNMPGTAGGPLIMSNYVGCKIDVNSSPQFSLFGVDMSSVWAELVFEAQGIWRNQLAHFS